MNIACVLGDLGELEQNSKRLWEAMDAYEAVLALRTIKNNPEGWAATHANIAICCRSLARLTGDSTLFDRAEASYEKALQVRAPGNAAYDWANTIGGLGELALDRFALDPDPALLEVAEKRLADAKSIMSKSDEVLNSRIDDLLEKTNEMRKQGGIV
ncbi:hypothetical protein RA19_06770 [Leisingera sp. ANG-M1]|uniref:hypothetical protein n=1 Tax=Leisingera sp. ANG-M1 TaxID=1577895 RepID=UPI00057F8FAA|nr:hypothetical protein [Leisingera sp. ANG-M1]KIC11067.1 hypothetical protein RA19_06770 [Leisingera sp. ANG-M1]